MLFFKVLRTRTLLLCCSLGAALPLVAAERVQLRNGFSVDCDHREPGSAGRVRLVLDGTSNMEVEASLIVSVEAVEPALTSAKVSPAQAETASLSLNTLIASAGAARHLNLDLLHSVIDAESGGHPRAVSRTGAQGLMQLMPATARSLGVHDSFSPEDNLRGGTAYLDRLLTRYHDDLVLALAAYNAGPGAVDRYHGVPPYRETIAYVSRIVREFNRRTLAAQRAGVSHATAPQRTALLGANLP